MGGVAEGKSRRRENKGNVEKTGDLGGGRDGREVDRMDGKQITISKCCLIFFWTDKCVL